MADNTKIEWTEATWNPITGCSVASPGCTNCYAMKLAGTRLAHHPSRAGLTRDSKAGPVWTGKVRMNEEWLTQPLRWKRPRMIFVCAHGDLFHESVPDEWIDRVFAVMALAPQHTFQVLTKRSARMREYLSGFSCDGARRFHIADAAGRLMRDGDRAHAWVAAGCEWPLPNVWLGVSVEDQTRADERIPDLLATPAAVRWLSCEPLLGPVDLTYLDLESGTTIIDALAGRHGVMVPLGGENAKLDWIVVGGESGPNARPMHPAWARSLRDQCQAAGVPFFFKQWGEWAPCEIDQSGGLNPPMQMGKIPQSRRWLNGKPVAPSSGVALEQWMRPGVVSFPLGKKAAGRLLDGVEHNGYPEVRNG